MEITLLLMVVALIGFAGYKFLKRGTYRNKQLPDEVPQKWKAVLDEKILFYHRLSPENKIQFESDVLNFLSEVRITGVKTEVEIEDRLLVASSAVIPLFGFPTWNYQHLDEVLLYPSAFDRNFNLNNPNEIITGMVGNGPMEGKMILSKPALHAGFDVNSDKRNVGIHEFVHLFDKEDRSIDGVPPNFQDKSFSIPWLDFIKKKTSEIEKKRSDIDSYATYNYQEFFAVASEYFFERPDLLQKKHPKLYELLSETFQQDMKSIIPNQKALKRKPIGRNSPCPCGSGEKYKNCCLLSN